MKTIHVINTVSLPEGKDIITGSENQNNLYALGHAGIMSAQGGQIIKYHIYITERWVTRTRLTSPFITLILKYIRNLNLNFKRELTYSQRTYDLSSQFTWVEGEILK